jgi:outer membrane lipoprotein carrier protein
VTRRLCNPAYAAALVALAAAPAAAGWPYDTPPSLDADELLARVTDRYERLADFRADLTVVTSSAFLGETASSTGKLYAKTPNLLRVEFTTPYEQTVVFDGEYLYAYVAGADQAVRYAGADVGYLVDLPGTLESLATDYDVALVSETGGQAYELRLTAEKTTPAFREIRIWVDPETSLARRADFYDRSGNVTSYRLSAYRVNAGLAPSLFRFDVPAGVEVVELAGSYRP